MTRTYLRLFRDFRLFRLFRFFRFFRIFRSLRDFRFFRLLQQTATCLAVLATFLFAACEQKDNVTRLELGTDTVVFGKGGGRQKVFVDTDARKWKAQTKADHLDVKADGDSLVVDCDPSEMGTNITDIVTVTAGDLTRELTVTQQAKAARLTVSPAKVHFGRNGGTQTVTFSCDGDNVDIRVDAGIDAQLDSDNRQLTVSVGPNRTRKVFRGTVVLKSDNLKQTVSITQEGIDTDKVRCQRCGGRGQVVSEIDMSAGGKKTYETCPECGGKGKI